MRKREQVTTLTSNKPNQQATMTSTKGEVLTGRFKGELVREPLSRAVSAASSMGTWLGDTKGQGAEVAEFRPYSRFVRRHGSPYWGKEALNRSDGRACLQLAITIGLGTTQIWLHRQ